MSKVTWKSGTFIYPLPAVMVSCGTMEESNIITVAWTGIINTDPAMCYISVRPTRHSYEMIKKTGEFVINLTTKDLAYATDWCGVKTGAKVDKFKEMKLTPLNCSEVSCPMIAESPINLECKVREIHEYPTHDMFVAEIVKIHVDTGLMEEDGRLSADKAGLLAYVHGEYFGIKKNPIGRFGFSVMKRKTKKRINREKNLDRKARNHRRRRG